MNSHFTLSRRFRVRLLPTFFLVLTCLCVCSLGSANTYYVAATGNDNNNGSQTAPFRQIRAALSRLHPGDTVLIGDGSYLGFDIDHLSGGQNSPITIKASGSNCLITTTTDRPNNRDTTFVTYSSFIVLDGLRAFNANRAAIRIDHCQHVAVRNGVFGNNAMWGIFTDFSDYLLLEKNECYGTKRQHGIYVSNTCVNPVVRRNRLHDNYQCGLHMNGDMSEGGAGVIKNATIEGNIIYNNGAGGGAGINMDGVQYSMIRNNLLYNNRAGGITGFQTDAAAGPVGDQILSNTVDMPPGSRWALHLTHTVGLNTVRNNILYNGDSSHGGLDYGSTDDIKNVNSDYNIMDRITTDDGDTVYKLGQWKVKGYELHSLSSTPTALWVNPGAGDYHLLPKSPAINAGQALAAVPFDLEGNAWPVGTPADIGCYERSRHP